MTEGLRVPPHDETAEQATIGGVLVSKEALEEVTAILRPEDFYRPAHELIWATILRLHTAGSPVDVQILGSELGPSLTRIGGPVVLATLASFAATSANTGYYARIVLGHALNRRLVERGTRIAQLGFAGGDANQNLAAAQAEILALEAPDGGTGRWIGPIVEDALEAAESGSEAVPTRGWGYGPEMPPMICGRMTILAGRPGMGKSTAGLDAARHVAIHLGLPVAFFTLEMSQAEVGARTAAAEAGIPLPNVQHGHMTPANWDQWAKRVGAVLDAPLWVDDFPRADPAYIHSTCRRLERENGPLGLVVIDYLQLMEEPRGNAAKPRQQTVSEFSRALTLLAKELRTPPVLALSQLNRGPENRTDKKPQMSDLRESGSLEQDASQVILIHREDAYEKESPRAGEVDLIIAKNRGGPTSTVTLAAQLHYSRFVAMSRETEPAATGDRAA